MGHGMSVDSAIDSTTHTWSRTKTLNVTVPPDKLSPFLDHLIGILERNKLLSQLTKSSTNGITTLQYRLTGIDGGVLDVAIRFLTDKVEIYYAPYPKKAISDKDFVKLDLEIESIIRSYFTEQSKASLFLVFSPKMTIMPKTREGAMKKALGSIILGNFLWFFVIIIFFGIVLFPFLGYYTPLALIAIQGVILLFAGKLIKFRGEFQITSENPSIYVAELMMKRNEFDHVIKTCIPNISEVKRKIYEATLGQGKDLDPAIIVKTLNDYGAVCVPELVRIKGINIYNLVKDLGSKFGVVNPTVTLLNVLVPNAAATGISPKRATVLVTSGLVASMTEDEIRAVLAHEFSHVRARDPLFLFSFATAMYLFGVYFVLPLLPVALFLTNILYLVYLFFSFTLLFFVAKFLEARADLDSAVATEKPKMLADSLRKLGLFKFQSHAFEIIRAQDWVNWDTHPPLYYRIRTLEQFDVTLMHHTQLEAIKGCIRGFINSLSGK
jgi:heat shock protein HtpX